VSLEQRVRDLERVVAMLLAERHQRTPHWYYGAVADGIPFHFEFNGTYGNVEVDVEFE
jgi:hypothetical protein